MPPIDPVDETAPDHSTDRAPVRLAQALPEVLDRLDRHRRTTTARTDAESSRPHPSPSNSRSGHTHRRHRPSASSEPAR